MRFRKLRIAWSVAWGVVAVLLIVLWMRSYTWLDQSVVRVSSTYHLMVNSQLGGVSFYLDNSPRVIRTHMLVDALYAKSPKPQHVEGMFYFYHGMRKNYGRPK